MSIRSYVVRKNCFDGVSYLTSLYFLLFLLLHIPFLSLAIYSFAVSKQLFVSYSKVFDTWYNTFEKLIIINRTQKSYIFLQYTVSIKNLSQYEVLCFISRNFWQSSLFFTLFLLLCAFLLLFLSFLLQLMGSIYFFKDLLISDLFFLETLQTPSRLFDFMPLPYMRHLYLIIKDMGQVIDELILQSIYEITCNCLVLTILYFII